MKHEQRASYEADLSVFIQLLESERDAVWAQAAWAMEMARKYGRGTARMLAADTGRSASYIRQLVATAKAFPEPESRVADLSFSHHRLAAMTEEPERWIELAAERQLSVADMKEAIRVAKERLSAAEEAQTAAERLENAARKFNERFATLAGRRVILTWETVQSPGTAATEPTAHTA